MFFIEDHQADIFRRREYAHARADHDPRLAAADPVPFVIAFPRRQPAVQDRDPVLAETPDEPLDDLIRQRDLRHQHDGGLSKRQTFGDRFHIDFCLAAGRHAMQ